MVHGRSSAGYRHGHHRAAGLVRQTLTDLPRLLTWLALLFVVYLAVGDPVSGARRSSAGGTGPLAVGDPVSNARRSSAGNTGPLAVGDPVGGARHSSAKGTRPEQSGIEVKVGGSGGVGGGGSGGGAQNILEPGGITGRGRVAESISQYGGGGGIRDGGGGGGSERLGSPPDSTQGPPLHLLYPLNLTDGTPLDPILEPNAIGKDCHFQFSIASRREKEFFFAIHPEYAPKIPYLKP
jgi:hypothetical protein